MTQTGVSRKKLDLDPIYIAVAKLLLQKNPDQISFSLVARKTNIPRTTLYYYFDSKIESLILQSMRFTLRDFMQVWVDTSTEPNPTYPSWLEMQKHKFTKALELLSHSPWILKLYFRYGSHPSFLGDEIRRIETLYLQNTKTDWLRYHSKPLSDRMLHLISHLKVGVLWGYIGEGNQWRGDEETLSEICAQVFSLFEQIEKE